MTNCADPTDLDIHCLQGHDISGLSGTSVKLLMFQYCESFRNVEQVELVENLHPNYLPFQFLHNLQPFLYYGKNAKNLIVLKPLNRIKLFVHSYNKWFSIKP